MGRTNTFYLFIVSFLAGVWYGSVKVVTLSMLVSIGVIILCLSISAWRYRIIFTKKSLKSKVYTVSFCILLSLVAFGIGALRIYIAQQGNEQFALNEMLGKEGIYEGVVVAEPDVRENGVKLIIDIGITKIITTTDFYPAFKYGDKVTIRGIITKPDRIADDTGRSFNYPGFLAKDGIFYVIKRPRIYLISHGNGTWIKEVLFGFKHSFLNTIHHALGDPEASLAGGLVVGAKQSLGKELEDDFRRAGIIHIVVLSGFNITIVAVAIMKVLSFLPETLNAGFGIVGLVLFAVLTGGTATVIRSTLMTFLVIAARLTRRDYDVLRGLSLAGFCMVMQNPRILLFDPSFELSFLATLGLILVSPYIKPFLKWIPEKYGLQEIAVSTFATQLFVLPYLLYQMGQLSIVGLVVNFLVLPLIPLTMLLIFLCGILGFVSTPVSFVFGFASYLLLAYELKIVIFFAHLSFASVAVKYFPLSMLCFCYGVYACVLLFLSEKRGKEV